MYHGAYLNNLEAQNLRKYMYIYLSSKMQAEISSKTSVILDLHTFVVELNHEKFGLTLKFISKRKT